MSHSFHAYLLDNQFSDEAVAFESIKNLFARTERVAFSVAKQPLTDSNYLRLKIDDHYTISVFLDMKDVVQEDLDYILRKSISCRSRLRVVFATDPNNDFDFIVVNILDFMEKLGNVIIYAVTMKKIIFVPPHLTSYELS